MTSADTHVAIAVVFDVPDGQETATHKKNFSAKTKAGTKGCLYYGFASLGNRVLCREGYKDGASFLQHLAEVKDDLAGMIKQVGKERVMIWIGATQADLDLIKPKMDERLTIKYCQLDSGAFKNPLPSGCEDTHVQILPELTVPDDKMEMFKAGFPKFYAATKAGAGAAGMLYYGFSVSGNSVFCREGYKNAEAVLLHGADIKDMMAEPMKAVGEGGVRINVIGPAAELEKLKPKLAPRGAMFWELESGAFWM